MGWKLSETLIFSLPFSLSTFLPAPVGFSGTLTLPAAVGFRIAGLTSFLLRFLLALAFFDDAASLAFSTPAPGTVTVRVPVPFDLFSFSLPFLKTLLGGVLAIETASTPVWKMLSPTALAIRSRTVWPAKGVRFALSWVGAIDSGSPFLLANRVVRMSLGLRESIGAVGFITSTRTCWLTGFGSSPMMMILGPPDESVLGLGTKIGSNET